MKPAPFAYRRPESVAEALDWLREDEAKILAGGQSLVPLMNLRLARPASLIDLNALPELARVIEDSQSLIIGALVRHRALETLPVIVSRIPLLAEAARHIGHIGIRNRGTLGGTITHADPASELPCIAAMLGGTVYLESLRRGKRAVRASEFATGFFTTQAEPDEIVTWVRIPTLRNDEGWGFAEVARRHGDFAIAGAAATLRIGAHGRIDEARAGVLGAGDSPAVLGAAALVGQQPEAAVFGEWAHAATAELVPMDRPAYRRRVATAMLRRALTQAAARCMEGHDA